MLAGHLCLSVHSPPPAEVAIPTPSPPFLSLFLRPSLALSSSHSLSHSFSLPPSLLSARRTGSVGPRAGRMTECRCVPFFPERGTGTERASRDGGRCFEGEWSSLFVDVDVDLDVGVGVGVDGEAVSWGRRARLVCV